MSSDIEPVGEYGTPRGAWFPHTALHDFCERNYDLTPLLVETRNAVSALFFVFAGAFLLWQAKAMQKDRSRKATARHFALAGVLEILLGVGSCLFHATLQRWAQAMDEIVMLLMVVVFHTIFSNGADHPTSPYPRSRGQTHELLNVQCASLFLLYFAMSFEVFLSVFVGLLGRLLLLLRRRGVTQLAVAKTAAVIYVGGYVLLWIPAEVYHQLYSRRT